MHLTNLKKMKLDLISLIEIKNIIQINIKISIYGADQKLYDGRPMNLNVNLDIDINAIIKSYLGSSGR